MPSLESYNASTADWARLRDYARRVARETRMPRAAPVSYVPQAGMYIGPGQRAAAASPATPRRGLLGFLRGDPAPAAPVAATPRPVQILGEHWLLEQRVQHIRDGWRRGGDQHEETTHYTYRWVLSPTGELVMSTFSEEEVENRTTRPYSTFSRIVNYDHSQRAMNDSDLAVFDFEKRWYDTSHLRRSRSAWGDYPPGRRLIRHAKGVGLSIALKALLEGRSR